MDWKSYQRRFRIACSKSKIESSQIDVLLRYAKYLNDNTLPVIYDDDHLALLLGYKKELLYRITNCSSRFYHNFFIPKRNGKLRRIREPYPTLKEIQYWILHNILEHIQVSKFAKAYILHKELLENVRFHKHQSIVIKLDLKDFFESITEPNITYIFHRLGYTSKLSGLLSRLCCLDGHLPQGAPTSPYLSNVFCKPIDKRISKYLLKQKLRYTRYSDDITISGVINNHQIACIINFVGSILSEYGLTIQKSKTKILRKNNRQMVTGIILNDKLSAGKKRKRDLRQQIYYIKKFGIESHIMKANITESNYLYHLMGEVNWVLYIEKGNKEFLEYRTFISDIMSKNNVE